jgi:energy-coupling factor transport system permease protein
MIRAVVIGQFVPGGSAVHRLGAATKLLVTLVYAVLLFVAPSWTGQAVLAAFALAALLLARLPAAAVWRGLRPVAGLLVFTFALNALATPGAPLWRLGPVVLTREGVEFGGRMAVRLLLLVLAGSLLTLTTNPIDLTDGVEALLRPFRRLGVPAHELAMMMTIALRFIPTLLEEAERISRAQAARGADFDSGSPARRLRSLAPILVPLFLSAFRRADELAVAMEARCYRGGVGRSRYRERRLGWRDGIAGAAALGLAVAVGWLRWRGI